MQVLQILLETVFNFLKCSAKVSRDNFCMIEDLEHSVVFNNPQYDFGSADLRLRSFLINSFLVDFKMFIYTFLIGFASFS